VANTFSDASPATAHLRLLADAVKQAISQHWKTLPVRALAPVA